MSYARTPMRQAARTLQQETRGISACGIVGIAVGVVVVALAARSIPDLMRYIRINAM